MALSLFPSSLILIDRKTGETHRENLPQRSSATKQRVNTNTPPDSLHAWEASHDRMKLNRDPHNDKSSLGHEVRHRADTFRLLTEESFTLRFIITWIQFDGRKVGLNRTKPKGRAVKQQKSQNGLVGKTLIGRCDRCGRCGLSHVLDGVVDTDWFCNVVKHRTLRHEDIVHSVIHCKSGIGRCLPGIAPRGFQSV